MLNAWDVRTVKKSSVTLHNGTVEDIFTINSGPVELVGLVLHITEAVSAHACAIGFELDPTVGASNTPLDNKTADLNGVLVGTCFGVAGASGTALASYVNGTAVPLMANPHQVLMPGGIDYVPANPTPTSGVGDVYLTYRPLAVDATVTAS